jgi:peptide/nickel transport system substrate-binding protein
MGRGARTVNTMGSIGLDARRRRRVAAVAAVAVLLGGCTSGVASSSAPSSTGSSGGTLHVVSTTPTFAGLDPQAEYPGLWEFLRCCLVRTLMTYPGVSDIAGTRPVPDLAAAPPSVSPDGITWTFHLRHGLHYAPPLQDVEVTSGDVVRALLRNNITVPGGALSGSTRDIYLPLIDGYSDYAAGRADAIAGVSTPDEFTIRVRETRPDTSIVHLFAMPFTAPIPPLPGDPDAPLGVATGHALTIDTFEGPPTEEGYGRFLVATGPYMFEGAQDLDFTLPPDLQQPIAGFSPGWCCDDPGEMTLVRNPSWSPASDPNRRALVDRIEVSIAPSESPYEMLRTGAVDVVMGEDPPIDVLEHYRASPALQDRVVTTTGATTTFATINVAQPPFDDPHVRRALVLGLDRGLLAEASRFSVEGSAASHLVPDPMERSLLSSWKALPSPNQAGDEASARAEMDDSRYAVDGKCSGSACRDLVVAVGFGDDHRATAAVVAMVRRTLAALGIQAIFRTDANTYSACNDPTAHIAACFLLAGWGADYPDAGNMFIPELSSSLAFNNQTLLGSTPEQLREWHYSPRHVPSIDSDYARCAAEVVAVRASMCWARLDQLLVGQLAAIIPMFTPDVVRLEGANVTSFSLDQAFGEPSLDRIAVAAAPSEPGP